MPNRGIKYSLWSAQSSLYFVLCLYVYLLCFHMDLNSLRYFFAWREERAQMNPYFWNKHPVEWKFQSLSVHWVLKFPLMSFPLTDKPFSLTCWDFFRLPLFIWFVSVACFLLCSISFSLFADEKKTSHFALIKAEQHAVAILAAGSSSSSCESTTSVHFTKGWLSVCLPVCLSHVGYCN